MENSTEKTYWYIVEYRPFKHADLRQISLKAINAQEAVNKVRYDGLMDENKEVINPYEVCFVYREVKNWS